MTNRVVITGFGLITPVGHTIEDFWNSLINGKSGVGPVAAFDASEYPTRIAAEVKNFDPLDYMDKKDVRRTDRFVQFAIAASKNALKHAGISMDAVDAEKVGVYIGSGIGGLTTFEEQHKVLLEKGPKRVSPFFIPMLIANMASGQVSIELGAKGDRKSVV